MRDPRAMITSVARRPGVWAEALRNSSFQCGRMLDDCRLAERLPPNRSVVCRSAMETNSHIQVYQSSVRRFGREDQPNVAEVKKREQIHFVT